MEQDDLTNQNRIAWEAQSYEAWVAAYGSPSAAADDLVRDPKHKLRKILPSLGDPSGVRIANPLGSHGRVAVALALLEADVTVFDLSSSNKQYATDLATPAGVDIDYKVGDFLALAEEQSLRSGSSD